MANAREKAATQLREITECSICMNAFTDPRMLPCIHTFCFQCLKRTAETTRKKPGDKVPCPLCQRQFIIPPEGITGLQRNFFMENFMEYRINLQMESDSPSCYSCNIRNDGKRGNISRATKRCLECRDDYCDSCSKVHQIQKVTKNHHIANIGSETKEEIRRMTKVKSCTKHIHRPLDYYCAECKKIVCVSCFVESHKLHDCKDVTTVDEEFRQLIEKRAWKIPTYVNEMLLLRNIKKKREADFVKEIAEKEKAIHERHEELKDMIDRHTQSLFTELSLTKSLHLKELENQMEEIDRCCTILTSFEAYCIELKSKGTASDICSSIEQLILRADELEKDHEAFIGSPQQSVKVSFQTIDLRDVLQNSNGNFVGNIEVKTETTVLVENFVVLGLDDGLTITKDVVKINLDPSKKISTLEQIPTEMAIETFAAVYCNTMYVTGLGVNCGEIWKYNIASGWIKCASLVQGRRRHSAAFIDEVLYVCGGREFTDNQVIDSVEAYNAVTDKCRIVGKLGHCVKSSGNCVPFKSSLYIFGGSGIDNKAFNDVQVYNTRQNICTLLSKPMPSAHSKMRAVIWKTSAILLGRHTCFIFNFETETWQTRKQFKTDVKHFGLVLKTERVYVIGGGISERGFDDDEIWKCRDDVRYIPLQNILHDKAIGWKIHATLPQPALIHAYDKLIFFVS